MFLNESDNVRQSEPSTKYSDDWLVWHEVGVSVVLTMCILTFVYGLISWKIIRKFRNFKNYMYLNAVLVNILRLLLVAFVYMVMLRFNVDFDSQNVVFQLMFFFTFIYLTMAYNHWLLIINYIFYVDVVKVFQKDIKRKYLKSWLFGWVLPFVILIVLALLFSINRNDDDGYDQLVLKIIFVWLLATCNLVPIFVNLIIFFKVLWALFLYKDTSGSMMTKKERCVENCRRLSMVAAGFALSSAVMLTSLIWQLFNFVRLWRALSLGLEIIALVVYVPLVKSNRELWREYFEIRSRRVI